MARTLNIYTDILPNVDGAPHIYADERQTVLNYLAPHLVSFFTLNNYRINTGVIRVSIETLSSRLSLADLDHITYLIDYDALDEQGQYWRCYFVHDAIYQNGYIIMHVDIDFWGTFQPLGFDCNGYKIHRCNRNIGIGVYDEVTAVNVKDLYDVKPQALTGESTAMTPIIKEMPYGTFAYADESELAIIFVAHITVARNLANTENVNATYLLGIELDRVRAVYQDAGVDTSNIDGIELAIRLISGIYGITAGNGVDNDAEVVNAFLMPANALYGTGKAYKFVAKTPYTSANNNLVFQCQILNSYTLYEYVPLPSNKIDLNYECYAGVFDDGLKIAKMTKDSSVVFTYVMNIDGLRVTVRQGDNEKDITDDFAVSLSGNAEGLDYLQQAGWWLKRIADYVSHGNVTAGTGKSSSYAAAGVSWGASMANLLSRDFSEKTKATGTISKGDGVRTFSFYFGTSPEGTGHYVGWPYYLTRYKSVADEYRHARYYGATFNVDLTDLANLEQYPLLGRDDSAKPMTYTYVEADFIGLVNLPRQAHDIIQDKLRRGIYVNFIRRE